MTLRRVLNLRHHLPSWRRMTAHQMTRRCKHLRTVSQVSGTNLARDGDFRSACADDACHTSHPLPPTDQQQGLHSQDVLRAAALQRVCVAQEEAPEERRTSVSVCAVTTALCLYFLALSLHSQSVCRHVSHDSDHLVPTTISIYNGEWAAAS